MLLFRIDEVIANPIKLLFLAYVNQIALEPGAIVAFMATVILFSFSGTGTPNSGGGIGFRAAGRALVRPVKPVVEPLTVPIVRLLGKAAAKVRRRRS